MTAGELPPEQVIGWLRSPEGEEWSFDRISRQQYLPGSSISPASVLLNGYRQRDVAYVPGFFSLREQAGYCEGSRWL